MNTTWFQLRTITACFETRILGSRADLVIEPGLRMFCKNFERVITLFSFLETQRHSQLKRTPMKNRIAAVLAMVIVIGGFAQAAPAKGKSQIKSPTSVSSRAGCGWAGCLIR
jgi:hypothetical protein